MRSFYLYLSNQPLSFSRRFLASQVIDDWELGVDAPRNLVLVSMASLIDPSLAPSGCHVIHAYVPATEPYEAWEGLDRKSKEYRDRKEEAAEVSPLGT